MTKKKQRMHATAAIWPLKRAINVSLLRFELLDVTGGDLMSQMKFEPCRALKNKGCVR